MERTMIDMERIAYLLKLLGDKTRLTMIAIIKQRESCVCELLEVFQMSQPSVSQHLRKLKDAGLVKETRRGQWVYYSLNQNSDLYPMVEDVLQHAPEQSANIKKTIDSNPTERCC